MSKEEQLLLATNIEKHYTCRIIKSDNEPFTLFCVADIGKILGTRNINKNVSPRRFNYDDRVLVKSVTNGGEQYMVFVTYNGLLKIFSCSRKTELIDFSKKVGIDVKNNFYSCIEADTIKCLLKSFSGEEMIEQYIVGDNDYRIDLYFPQYKIAVECDESHHKTITNKLKDLERQSAIKDVLNCIFIRYDPFCEEFNIFTLINEIFTKIMDYKTNEKEIFEIEKIKIITNHNDTMIELKYKEFQIEYVKLLELEKMRNINNNIDVISETQYKELEEITLKYNEIQENTKIENVIEKPQNEITKPREEVNYVKSREHTRSPKVYQYNPETLELIQMYDSIINVIREFHSSSPSALKLAAKNNTIYKDFRWLLVDRNTTDVPVLPPTVESRTQAIEYIAMIDIQQTKILDVFPSQKEAAMARNLAGFSTISRAIKQKSISSGHYWNLFHRCSQEMRNEYLKTNTLPEQHVKSNGISVIQIHPVTMEKITEYKSITEVLKKFQMSRISLIKASETNEIHNGFRWKTK
jgi:hypothetical protein